MVTEGVPVGSGSDGVGPFATAPWPRPVHRRPPTRPMVSVVVPMRNERRWIDACLAGFERQTWPHDLLEVIVVDGRSDDGSRQRVEWWARSRPWLTVVDNPQVRASAAFNRGLAEARGDLVVLFGAHAVADPEFIERSVATLERTAATGVGGRLDHVGCDGRSTAIGLAMTSPFGMASPFRFASVERQVDTVGHPMYRRAAVVAVGGFDERLERNSDYVLNWRLRQGGGRLVFDPTIRSTYRPRGDLRTLGRQFYDYGRAKADVARRHPGSIRLRHLVPPALVLAGALAPLAWWTPLRRAVGLLAAAYVTGIAAAAAHARRRGPGGEVAPVTLVAAFPVMHLAWGGGFLAGMLRRRRRAG